MISITFDLDGTLVTTEPEHRYFLIGTTLYNLGFSEYHHTTLQDSHKRVINSIWFQGDRDQIIETTFKIPYQDFWTEFNIHDTIDFRLKYTKPYSDIDFVKSLKGRGVKTGIVTGAPPRIMTAEVALIGVQFFDVIISSHPQNGYNSKPDPRALLDCIKEMGADITKTIYVGNSGEDLNTANNAGIPCYIVNRKEHAYDIEANFIPDLYALEKLLE